jgi:hypothetical protein
MRILFRAVGVAALLSMTVLGRAQSASISVRVVPLPEFTGIDAIWGAAGNDLAGRVWLGLSSRSSRPLSALLLEYDPETDVVQARGDALSALRAANVRADGLEQAKIHSRIVQMSDGAMYFASMDEEGENADGSRLPTWGGHLWRSRGPRFAWEHLLSTPEALIAVAGGGRYVYALGYFDHVLYQYDIHSTAVRSVRVGSAGGHVSRNIFADDHGHVFVPRVRREPAALRADLVQFDARLEEVGSTPLDEYFERDRDDSHGIVAIQPVGPSRWAFTTGKGRLYEVE